ncbi:MAG: hypothetical protein WA160_14465 [Pseudobdellovibrio sp.]
MNIIKTVIIALTVSISLSALASEPSAEVIEHCSHDIMKLVKQNKLPPEAASKLHMMRVTEVVDGFEVVAVLDHNEDHTNPPAQIKFQYNAAAKMTAFQYEAGYVNPNATPFNKISTAKLYDIAAEVLLDSEDMILKEYAKGVEMMHLSYDKTRNAALFEMIDTNKKELNLWLDLDGNTLEVQFLK